MKILIKFYLVCVLFIFSIILISYNSLFVYIISLIVLFFANLFFIRGKFSDVRYIFLIIFLFYNVCFPLGYILNVLELKFYSYNVIDYKNSLLLSCIFLSGFLTVNIITYFYKDKNGYEDNNSILLNNNTYYICILFLVIGLIGFIYFIIQNTGSLSNYFKTSRFDIISNLNQTYLPIIGDGKALILSSSIVLLYNYKYLSKLKKSLFVMILGIYVAIELLGGNRLYPSYLIVTIIGMSFDNKIVKKQIKIGKLFIFGVIFIIFFQFVGTFRSYLPALFNKSNISQSQIMDLADDNQWINIFKESEFNGPYYTLITSVSNNYKNVLHGSSYLQGLLDCIPEKLRFNNFQTQDLLRETFIKEFFYYSHYVTGAGLGFSPVAEAYINSATLGVYISGFLFSLLFWLLNVLTLNKGLKRLFYYNLLFIAMDGNRISFLGYSRTYAYMCLFTFILILFNRLVNSKKICK